jgi:hypothetical protein
LAHQESQLGFLWRGTPRKTNPLSPGHGASSG